MLVLIIHVFSLAAGIDSDVLHSSHTRFAGYRRPVPSSQAANDWWGACDGTRVLQANANRMHMYRDTASLLQGTSCLAAVQIVHCIVLMCS
jgi:hypothetical protein